MGTDAIIAYSHTYKRTKTANYLVEKEVLILYSYAYLNKHV